MIQIFLLKLRSILIVFPIHLTPQQRKKNDADTCCIQPKWILWRCPISHLIHISGLSFPQQNEKSKHSYQIRIIFFQFKTFMRAGVLLYWMRATTQIILFLFFRIVRISIVLHYKHAIELKLKKILSFISFIHSLCKFWWWLLHLLPFSLDNVELFNSVGTSAESEEASHLFQPYEEKCEMV